MCDFTESSQLQEWMFASPEMVQKCRATANQMAREYLSKPPPSSAASSSSSSQAQDPPVYAIAHGYAKNQQEQQAEDPTTVGPWKTASEHPFLTPDEEALLVAFYARKVPTLVGPLAQVQRLHRDIKVTATAAMFLRRFYLSNSVMIHDPKAIMVAAAFVATKVEDATVDIRALEEGSEQAGAPVTQAEILPAELALMEGICFQLLCFHPFKPIMALTEDLRTFLKSEKGLPLVQHKRIAGEDLKPMYDAARAVLDDVIVSDIPLLYTPGQIGLAAMMVANDDVQAKQQQQQQTTLAPELSNPAMAPPEEDGGGLPSLDLLAYVRLRFSEEQGAKMEAIMKDLVPMMRELREGKHGCGNHNIDMVQLKSVHKRLKKCRGWGKKEKKSKNKRSSEDGGGGEPKKKKVKA